MLAFIVAWFCVRILPHTTAEGDPSGLDSGGAAERAAAPTLEDDRPGGGLAVEEAPNPSAGRVLEVAHDRATGTESGNSPDFREGWATFRGDPQLRGARSGHIRVPPKLLWTHDAGDGVEATPAIVDGHVFVGSYAGLLALELDPRQPDGPAVKEGRRAWMFPIEAGTRSSPAVAGGLVFLGDDYGVFHAIDTATGKEKWAHQTEDEAEIISSPNFFGDSVIFGSYDGHIYCLNTADGTVRWRYQTEGQVHATLAVAGDYTFVAGCDEFLRVVHLPTGEEKWALPVGGNCAASPAVKDHRLYLGTFSSQVLAIDWRSELEARLKRGVGEPVAGDLAPDGKLKPEAAASTAIAWRYEHPRRKFPYYASPALGTYQKEANGTRRAAPIVVAAGRDKMVHGIDGETGVGVWTFPTKARVDASPVVVGDHVIAAGLDGTLYLLGLSDGKEVWRFTAGDALRASPAVGEGKLVVASDEGLVYCFDLLSGGGGTTQKQ